MTLIDRILLKQRAVLWAFVSHDQYGEVKVSDTPVEIRCQWDQTTQESVNSEATPIATTASIPVDRDITEGSLLRLGKLADLPSPVEDGLVEVVTFIKTPDVKARKFYREVGVREFKDALPTQVSS